MGNRNKKCFVAVVAWFGFALFFHLLPKSCLKEVELCLKSNVMLACGWVNPKEFSPNCPERVGIASRYFTFPDTKHSHTSSTRRLHCGQHVAVDTGH